MKLSFTDNHPNPTFGQQGLHFTQAFKEEGKPAFIRTGVGGYDCKDDDEGQAEVVGVMDCHFQSVV